MTQHQLLLAQYRNLDTYTPNVGDFVIWAGWFTTWYGVVSGSSSDALDVILDGSPVLLFSMPPVAYAANTRKITLSQIFTSMPGTWAILRHDQESRATVWYV